MTVTLLSPNKNERKFEEWHKFDTVLDQNRAKIEI